MKFSEEVSTDINLIHEYEDTFVVVKTKQSELVTVSKNLVITSQQLITEYKINSITDFSDSDLNYIKNLDPEIVILSPGSSIQLSPQRSMKFSEHQIGVEMMPLGAACRTYNLLVSEGRRVALIINFPL